LYRLIFFANEVRGEGTRHCPNMCYEKQTCSSVLEFPPSVPPLFYTRLFPFSSCL